MPSRVLVVWSMLRAALYVFTIDEYSSLALLLGTVVPDSDHNLLLTAVFSPRSVRAMMFRVLLVVPLLLVTHTSTRLMVTPVVTLGRVVIALSYLSRKERE